MKDFRKDFKAIIDGLHAQKVCKKLQADDVKKVEKAWKKIVAKNKDVCRTWKKKYYDITNTDWILSKSKKLKISDHPIEICILIRLMNSLEDDKPIKDSEVVYDNENLLQALRSINDPIAENFAAIIMDGEAIDNINTEYFFEVFCTK